MATTAALALVVDARKALDALRKFERHVDSAGSSVARMAQRVRSDFRMVERAAGLMLAPLKAVVGVTATLKAGMLALGAASIRAAANYEMFRQQLRTVVGDKKRADEAFRESIEFSVRTPFTPEEIIRTRIALESVGVRGAAAVKSVAEAASAMNRPIQDVATALRSMEAEVLKNLAVSLKSESGKFLFEYQNAVGKMVKVAADGRKKAQEALLGIFEAKFGGGIERMSLTYGGLISTLQGAVQALRAEFGEGILNTVKLSVKDIIDGVNALMTGARSAGEALGKKLAEARIDLLAGFDVAMQVAVKIGEAMSKPGGMGAVILEAIKLGAKLLTEGLYLAFKSSLALWKTIGTILGQGVLDALFRSGLPFAGMARAAAIENTLREKPRDKLEGMAKKFDVDTATPTITGYKFMGGTPVAEWGQRQRTDRELADAIAAAITKQLPVEEQLEYAQWDPKTTIAKSIQQSQKTLADSMEEMGSAALGTLQQAIDKIAAEMGIESLDLVKAFSEARPRIVAGTEEQQAQWDKQLEPPDPTIGQKVANAIMRPLNALAKIADPSLGAPAGGALSFGGIKGSLAGLVESFRKAQGVEPSKLGSYIADLAEETRQLALSNEERVRAGILIKAQEAAQRDMEAGARKLAALTQEETRFIEQRADAYLREKEAKFVGDLDREIEILRDLNDVMLKGHSAYERAVELQRLINEARAQGIPITQELTQELRGYIEARDELARDREGYGGLLGGLTDLKGELPDLKQTLYDVGKAIREGVVGAFTDAVFEARNLKEAVAAIGKDVARMVFSAQMNRAIASMFPAKKQAAGGVWWNGQLQAFAAGGVFSSPYYFPMANGRTGLMGEAGPEAIMPLTRDSQGKLGVRASGASAAPNVVFHVENHSSAQIETQQTGVRFDGKRMIVGMLLKDERNRGPVSRSHKRR